NRAESPLRQASDAVYIDNAPLTKESQLAMVKQLVEDKLHN
ncbi:MAG: hypothetical protein RIS47_1858, partial [Bacteroidota bacterium]